MSYTWNFLGLKNENHFCAVISKILKTDAKLCPFCKTVLK